MKKRALLYSFLLLGATAFTSCTDMLDKGPLDEFTDSPEFWNNSGMVEGYANAFYNQFTGYGNAGGSGDFYFPSLTDDQVGAGFVSWKFVNVPAASSDWSSTWDEIRRSNAMIQSMTQYATTMDAATKNHWIGVARMMRAYQYFDLVRKFGDCTWLEKPLDVDSPELYAKRDDRDMVMDKVLEDLNFAVTNIKEASDKRYWSRDMAQAMKSYICLWEGTFRKYRTAEENGKGPDLEGAKRFLEESVKASEAVMPKYSLCENYQSLYNSVDLTANPEVIFCKTYKKDTFGHSTIDYTCTSTQQNGMSKDAFDSYLKLDGTLAQEGEDAGVLAVAEFDGQEHVSLQNIFEARDKRLSQQIDPFLAFPGKAWGRLVGGTAMTASTGYTVAKFDNLDLGTAYREVGGKNYTSAPLYWLAPIYLNFAEAKAELGTITNDDLNKSINLLKERAGLPAITTAVNLYDPDMDKAGVKNPLIWEIRRERRCELMFDNNFRYWDLIRWHQLHLLDTTTNPDIVLGANIAPANGAIGDVKVKGNYIDASKGDRVYDKKHYLYPIPSAQINLKPELGQNPGW